MSDEQTNATVVDAASQNQGAASLPHTNIPTDANNAPAKTAPIVSEPFYKDWIKPDGSLNKDAYARLPDHVKHLSSTMERYPTVEAFLTGIANLQTLAGKKGLAPLPANAPAEVVAERNALLRSINGAPEKPDGYGIQRPQDIPETAWDDAVVKKSAEVFHKYNATPQMVKELVAIQAESTKQQIKAQEAYTAQFFAAQDKAFGEAVRASGESLEAASDLASRTALRLGIDPTTNPVFKNADLRMALVKAGRMIGEDKFVSGETKGNVISDYAAAAKDIVSNKSNPEHAAYWDGNHPMNKSVKEKVYSLRAAAAAQRK